MEPYAQIRDAGPFAASADLFTTLVAELEGPAAAGLTACELEDLLAERGREVQRQLLQDHLDLRAAREEQAVREHHPAATGADGITRNRVETGHGRLLATLSGTVRVTRCAWRRPGAPSLCPADAALSLPAPRCSHALARLAAVEAGRGSFEAAHAAITRRCGPVVGKRQVEQAVVGAATDIAAFYAARIPVPCTASTLLVISADAKGIVMRPEALRPRTAKAATRQGRMRTRLVSGEKSGRKRMATLACVYGAEPAPRRPHDIIALPGGQRGHRTLRPRPKATGKWLAGSVRHDPAEVIAAAFSQAAARDPHHQRTWVVLADGAEHQLDLIRAVAARRGATIHIVIDFIHVPEHLWKAAWSRHPAADPAAEDRVAVKALTVLAGDSARAAAEITAQTETTGLTAAQRAGTGTCVRYLTGLRDHLRYDQALAAGWPIATGVIERPGSSKEPAATSSATASFSAVGITWPFVPRYARQSVRDAARRHTVSHVSECPVVASGRAFRVELPDGRAYWTVVDEEYVRVAVADQFLFDLRFGRDRAESTTRVYAGELARFLTWCGRTGRSLEDGAQHLSRFVLVLRTTPAERAGAGQGRPPGAARINHVLAVVREFFKHAVTAKAVDASVLGALYEVGDDRFLPAELRAEGGGLRYRARPRHRLRAGRGASPEAASQAEWEALLEAATSWRERFLLVLLWFCGLRIGETLGLRRADLHFTGSSTSLGCRVPGPHLHVVHRDGNPNGASAKSRNERTVPVVAWVLAYYDRYTAERLACPAADGCDFVFVNLFHAPLGAPMTASAVRQVMRVLSRRAGLARPVHPHMLRHSSGSEMADAGVPIDVVQELLGHGSITSTQHYVTPSRARMRSAVEAVEKVTSQRRTRRQEGGPR